MRAILLSQGEYRVITQALILAFVSGLSVSST